MSKVPNDPNMTPEVRRFLDDRSRAETQLQTDVDAAVAAIPALASQAEAEAGTDNAKYLSALRTAQAITALNPFAKAVHVQDQKAANTGGGTCTSGSWQTRVLNTAVTNTLTGASLGSNQVTLPAGTYFCFARAPVYRVNRHKVRIQDVTNTATKLIGASANSENAVGATVSDATVLGFFTLSGTAAVELQHQSQDTQTTDGFGRESNLGVTEVYAEALFLKVA